MKRKHPNLPNGYGSIRFLGSGRSRPYAVHPPATQCNDKGRYITPKAICYCADWYTAFAVLTAWHQGRYYPGMELDIAKERQASYADLDAFCRRVLSTIGAASDQKTFGAVADEFMQYKYGRNAPRALAERTQYADKNLRKHLSPLDHIPIDNLSLQKMQETVNAISAETIRGKAVVYIKQVFRFAVSRGYIQRNESDLLHTPGVENEHAEPFTDADLALLWKRKDDPNAAAALIMCYSGFRVSAYKDMEVNTNQMYFKGGVKTAAGRDRIVPIHSAIQPLLKSGFSVLTLSQRTIRRRFEILCADIGIGYHSPHGCRHTFSRLCETYGVQEADRKRLLGHSFGSDITNAVYGHRTLEELRASIEKITCPICDKL